MNGIGVVTEDAALGARIRDSLVEGGLDIAFETSALDLAAPAVGFDLIVVQGPLRAREGSPLAAVADSLPGRRLVACAPRTDARAIRWAVDHGADGVVWDHDLEVSLALTVRAVCAGQLVVPREVRRRIIPPDLTTREKQVLSLVVMGLSNGEIASKLYVSESTVKSHLGSAFRKLDVRSRAEAAQLVADPSEGFGTGILAITEPVLARRRARPPGTES